MSWAGAWTLILLSATPPPAWEPGWWARDGARLRRIEAFAEGASARLRFVVTPPSAVEVTCSPAEGGVHIDLWPALAQHVPLPAPIGPVREVTVGRPVAGLIRVTARLTWLGPSPRCRVRSVETGWDVLLAPAAPPAAASATPPRNVAPPAHAFGDLTWLAKGLRRFAEGRPADAYAAMSMALLPDAPPHLRPVALLYQGRALRALRLPLLALDPLARAVTSPDLLTARRATKELRATLETHPRALSMVSGVLLAGTLPAGADGAWLRLELGRALVREGRFVEAAAPLGELRRHPYAPRARYLIAVSLAVADDPKTAMVHLAALAADPRTPPAVRGHAALGLARLGYADGELATAEQLWRRVPPGPAAAEAQRDLDWLLLRRGQIERLLARRVPLALADADPLPLAIAYATWCCPRRAARLATEVINAERAARDPLLRALRVEATQLSRIGAALGTDEAQEALRERLAAWQRREAAMPRPGSWRLAAALRVRIAADAAHLAEAGRRMRPEPGGFSLIGGTWRDVAVSRGVLADRCPMTP